ncbi:MAG: hypothetical protein DIZ80_06525 [endosymbiont of Galathealinum brachiosum]|uniref:Uncharacterized protein n=1 Tax=endosymbiont of Galathealinum brachiosum TaxID=2200906 RepID=A0A370DFU7_9GAMM|nr:MAG: hypothetical protein DIZ80_06525 [endosymbiont of Galathealinum brachiosum]
MNKQRAIIDKFYQKFQNSMHSLVPALDERQLLQFQKDEFGANSYQQNEVFNHWLYTGRSINKRYYCLQNNEVVGQQSAIVVDLIIDNRVLTVAYAIDLRIRPEWKMKGLGVAMIGSLINEYDVVIGMGVSDEAHKMFKRQGWFDLGVVDTLVKPLTMSGFNDQAIDVGLISKLKYISALSLSKISDFYYKYNRPKAVFKKVKAFTSDHERIINDAYDSSAIRIIKDKHYLNWRFINFPDNEHYDVFELIEYNIPVAFFCVKMAFIDGSDVLIISEIHARLSDIPKVVDRIIELAKSYKASKITYSGLDYAIQKTLKSRCFCNRPYGDRFLVYSNAPELDSILKNKNRWRITNADSDAEFCLFNN